MRDEWGSVSGRHGQDVFYGYAGAGGGGEVDVVRDGAFATATHLRYKRASCNAIFHYSMYKLRERPFSSRKAVSR